MEEPVIGRCGVPWCKWQQWENMLITALAGLNVANAYFKYIDFHKFTWYKHREDRVDKSKCDTYKSSCNFLKEG